MKKDILPPPDFDYAPHQLRAGRKSPYRVAMGYETDEDAPEPVSKTREWLNGLAVAASLVFLWVITLGAVMAVVAITASCLWGLLF